MELYWSHLCNYPWVPSMLMRVDMAMCTEYTSLNMFGKSMNDKWSETSVTYKIQLLYASQSACKFPLYRTCPSKCRNTAAIDNGVLYTAINIGAVMLTASCGWRRWVAKPYHIYIWLKTLCMERLIWIWNFIVSFCYRKIVFYVIFICFLRGESYYDYIAKQI